MIIHVNIAQVIVHHVHYVFQQKIDKVHLHANVLIPITMIVIQKPANVIINIMLILLLFYILLKFYNKYVNIHVSIAKILKIHVLCVFLLIIEIKQHVNV